MKIRRDGGLGCSLLWPFKHKLCAILMMRQRCLKQTQEDGRTNSDELAI